MGLPQNRWFIMVYNGILGNFQIKSNFTQQFEHVWGEIQFGKPPHILLEPWSNGRHMSASSEDGRSLSGCRILTNLAHWKSGTSAFWNWLFGTCPKKRGFWRSPSSICRRLDPQYLGDVKNWDIYQPLFYIFTEWRCGRCGCFRFLWWFSAVETIKILNDAASFECSNSKCLALRDDPQNWKFPS